ncbi:SirB2 family protein [Eikenella sp. S3360]|uniref:SirB2 family protein n=1 Tax=Eikenella glucosivorans TaxID=2766967 RepID=A0ABS0N8H9_9NEIS|nr:SirB2 family protein [Eikenella glucosivorans]MBH5328628.1 SirB2 family protein [Eikenella glucosivorans]
MYLIAKHSHLLFVVITVILFNLRFWLRTARPQRPVPKALRILPHLNDTLLLLTGILLLAITRYTPFGNANWLGVKLILVVVYIFLGMFCLKSPPRSGKWWLGYALSMGCLCLIYWLATYKPLF